MESIKGYKAFIDISNESGGESCSEHFWAERTFGGYRIANIPFYSRQISYGDIVRLDDVTDEILYVVRSSGYRNGRIVYATDSDEGIQDQFKRIQLALEKHGILIEGATPGTGGLAIPDEITECKFKNIVKKIPDILEAESVTKTNLRKRK